MFAFLLLKLVEELLQVAVFKDDGDKERSDKPRFFNDDVEPLREFDFDMASVLCGFDPGDGTWAWCDPAAEGSPNSCRYLKNSLLSHTCSKIFLYIRVGREPN